MLIGVCRKTYLAILGAALVAGAANLQAQDEGPLLVSSFPTSGASAVPTSTVVAFTFSEAMKPQQNVLWFSGRTVIADSKFTYSWSLDRRTISCKLQEGWPGGAEISWALIGAVSIGFESEAGVALEAGIDTFGGFTTSRSGTGGPVGEVFTNSCGIVTTNFSKNVFTLSIQATYNQIGSGAPTPLSDDGFEAFLFTASALLDGGASARSIGLRTPNGTSIPLDGVRNSYFYFDSSNRLAGLQAKFKPGIYSFSVQEGTGLPSTLPATLASSPLPIIHVSNFNDAQAIDETQPFTLKWDALEAGAAAVMNATLYTSSDDEILASPDPECPGALNGNSTSWTLPAKTMLPNTTYTVDLELLLLTPPSSIDETTVVFSGYRIVTRLRIKTGKQIDPTQPFRITEVSRTETPQLRIVVSPTVIGKSYRLEQKPTLDTLSWSATGQSTVANGTQVELLITPPTGPGTAFYRVVTP